MKTIQKVFTAMSLAAVIGFVGCGDTKTELPPKTGTESHGGHGGPGAHGGHDGAGSHTEPKKTEPMKTEPMNTEQPSKVEPTLPDNDTKQPSTNEAASGSTEKKGGVDIPNEAASGSTEKKGGVNIPE